MHLQTEYYKIYDTVKIEEKEVLTPGSSKHQFDQGISNVSNVSGTKMIVWSVGPDLLICWRLSISFVVNICIDCSIPGYKDSKFLDYLRIYKNCMLDSFCRRRICIGLQESSQKCLQNRMRAKTTSGIWRTLTNNLIMMDGMNQLYFLVIISLCPRFNVLRGT